MKQRIVFLAAAFIVQSLTVVFGQEIQPRDSHLFTVDSDPRGAEIFLRDSLIGATPVQLPIAISDTLLLFYPSRDTWNNQKQVLTPPFISAEQGLAFVRFDRVCMLTSDPVGAAVFRQDSLLGHTPLQVRFHDLPWEIRIARPGFESRSILLTVESPDTMSVLLDPVLGARSVDRLSPPGTTLPIVIPAGGGLLAGTLAMVLKQKADKTYDEYLARGNTAALSDARRYDIYAGIALAVLELSFAYFAYLLFVQN